MWVEWLKDVTAIPAPLAPRIYSVDQGNGSVRLKWWNRPVAESVPFANGYRVKYRTSPGDYTHVVDVGNATGYIFRKMQNNTRYYISVAAFNRSGEGENAVEAGATPVINRPWPPYLVFAKECPDGSVNVSWTHSVLLTMLCLMCVIVQPPGMNHVTNW